ncbi:MAG TPA: aminoacyl-tRNA hydrolase, partial [Acidimicrobiaceae bacterium]|nr:aminoacyl-tRNA hydrolase [Acidimicrobiaceae bacterium]
MGLGNPGREYEGTRHNVGFAAVEELARRHGGSLKRSKQEALVAEVRIGGERVALALPQTYMNE